MKLNPILDYIIVQELDQPKSVIILDQAKSTFDATAYGHVIAAGPGMRIAAGFSPNSVKANDKVVFQRAFGTLLCISGRDVWILRESQVIATLTEGEEEMSTIDSKIVIGNQIYSVSKTVKDDIAALLKPYEAGVEPTDHGKELAALKEDCDKESAAATGVIAALQTEVSNLHSELESCHKVIREQKAALGGGDNTADDVEPTKTVDDDGSGMTDGVAGSTE